MWWWNMHDGFGWGGGWWMLANVVWMLLFWGGIIWLAVWGINKLAGGRAKEETPLKIAERRYARGEITRDEFENIRKTLAGGGPTPAASP
ncbi:MAG: SHOCT domain-containing protein [SAR202 cluster bacterium]|nr:SHOCT domain-containing protein [SAR202 cluster bacterium]